MSRAPGRPRPATYVVAGLLLALTAVLPTATATAAGTGTITGHVTNTAGEPLEDVDVDAYAPSVDGWSLAATTEVDEDGLYEIPALPPGRYRVKMSDAFGDYATQWWQRAADVTTATDVILGDGETRGGIDAVLAASGTAQVNLVPPRIVGTPEFGARLTADPGTWSQPGTTFTYDWSVAGRQALSGHGSSFVVDQPDDHPARLRVSLVVTASAPGYDDEEADADDVTLTTDAAATAGGAAGASRPALLRRPTISGVPRVGAVLVVRRGRVTPAAVATFQWLRGAHPIRGAHARTYRPVVADLGSRLRVRVTYRARGLAPLVVRTLRTAAVTAQ